MLKLRLAPQPAQRGALAVFLAEGAPVPPAWAAAAEAAAFSGKAGTSFEPGTAARRTLIVGLGTPDEAAARRAGALATARLSRSKTLILDARGLPEPVAVALLGGAAARAWRCDGFRTRPDPDASRLARIELAVDRPDDIAARVAAEQAQLAGADLARRLVALPANRLTPARFADHLRDLEADGLEVEVLKPQALRAERLNLLAAVGGSAAHGPRLVVLRWRGAQAGPPLAFIGKGLTFDTGGVSIKPAHKMWDMRADMAGAAACAGAMLALARRRSPVHAVAVLPLAENAVGAAAYRPGDVLRSHAGTTVEVIDTDAEGRLVLADALAWTIARFRPRAIVDLATLTGSIVIALGHAMAGLYANDPTLAAALAASGAAVGERVWPMPISPAHREDLNSDIADLRQCATGPLQPDACHAAAFLREFVDQTPWAHLDIAGVEQIETADDEHAAGPTGFGVRLLDRLVAMRFEAGEEAAAWPRLASTT